MAKPVGPACNQACAYCFYTDKKRLFPSDAKMRMSTEILEAYIRQSIDSNPSMEITFAWQGGEPTLAGLDFFREAVTLQKRFLPTGKRVHNAIQTNGILIDAKWCAFLRENGFLVGLSLDGPREVHDCHRRDRSGDPTFDRALRALELFREHGVEFNVLTTIGSHNARRPLEVYRFLKSHGVRFIQFIPLVERAGEEGTLAGPPDPRTIEPRLEVPSWCVRPLDYGRFLAAIFDAWVRADVGRIFIQQFDVHLQAWMGLPSSLCVFAETCGRAMVLEHNGDVYACDHFVYPSFRRGNLLETPLRELVERGTQRDFGNAKRDALPSACRSCEVRFACNGGCPKHRFDATRNGEPGLNHLCDGYRHFFHHIDPVMKTMAGLVRRGRPAAEIMPILAGRETGGNPAAPRRNAACPCGSGRKYKHCCGAATGRTRAPAARPTEDLQPGPEPPSSSHADQLAAAKTASGTWNSSSPLAG